MKTPHIIAVLLILGLASCDLFLEKSVQTELGFNNPNRNFVSVEDSLNYILGMGVSKQFANHNEGDYNVACFNKGLEDGLARTDFLIEQENMAGVAQRYMDQMNKTRDDSILNVSNRFLAKNAQRPEVKVTERGLQYEVVKAVEGEGISPDGNDVVKLKFSQGNSEEGILWDQTTAENPRDTIQMALNRELTGFSEACQRMKVGESWRVWLPPAIGSAEGRDPAGIATKYEVIYMEIELLGIIDRHAGNVPNAKEFEVYKGYFLDESKRILPTDIPE